MCVVHNPRIMCVRQSIDMRNTLYALDEERNLQLFEQHIYSPTQLYEAIIFNDKRPLTQRLQLPIYSNSCLQKIFQRKAPNKPRDRPSSSAPSSSSARKQYQRCIYIFQYSFFVCDVSAIAPLCPSHILY